MPDPFGHMSRFTHLAHLIPGCGSARDAPSILYLRGTWRTRPRAATWTLHVGQDGWPHILRAVLPKHGLSTYRERCWKPCSATPKNIARMLRHHRIRRLCPRPIRSHHRIPVPSERRIQPPRERAPSAETALDAEWTPDRESTWERLEPPCSFCPHSSPWSAPTVGQSDKPGRDTPTASSLRLRDRRLGWYRKLAYEGVQSWPRCSRRGTSRSPPASSKAGEPPEVAPALSRPRRPLRSSSL